MYLFSVIPEKCDNRCSCYYDSERNLNIYNCSARNLTQFPNIIPHNTNLLDLSKNKLNNVQDAFPYFRNIQHIDFSFNNISEFSDNLVNRLRNNSSIFLLDLAGNKITNLPESIKQLDNVTRLRLAFNPYNCHCDMLWMKNWLYKLSQKESFVQDLKYITCRPGPFSGRAIYELDTDVLGCAMEWYWIVILACVSVSIFMTIALVVHRNWEKLKFLLFVHFNILTTDDGVENLDEMLYDGFVSYR